MQPDQIPSRLLPNQLAQMAASIEGKKGKLKDVFVTQDFKLEERPWYLKIPILSWIFRPFKEASSRKNMMRIYQDVFEMLKNEKVDGDTKIKIFQSILKVDALANQKIGKNLRHRHDLEDWKSKIQDCENAIYSDLSTTEKQRNELTKILNQHLDAERFSKDLRALAYRVQTESDEGHLAKFSLMKNLNLRQILGIMKLPFIKRMFEEEKGLGTRANLLRVFEDATRLVKRPDVAPETKREVLLSMRKIERLAEEKLRSSKAYKNEYSEKKSDLEEEALKFCDITLITYVTDEEIRNVLETKKLGDWVVKGTHNEPSFTIYWKGAGSKVECIEVQYNKAIEKFEGKTGVDGIEIKGENLHELLGDLRIHPYNMQHDISFKIDQNLVFSGDLKVSDPVAFMYKTAIVFLNDERFKDSEKESMIKYIEDMEQQVKADQEEERKEFKSLKEREQYLLAKKAYLYSKLTHESKSDEERLFDIDMMSTNTLWIEKEIGQGIVKFPIQFSYDSEKQKYIVQLIDSIVEVSSLEDLLNSEVFARNLEKFTGPSDLIAPEEFNPAPISEELRLVHGFLGDEYSQSSEEEIQLFLNKTPDGTWLFTSSNNTISYKTSGGIKHAEIMEDSNRDESTCEFEGKVYTAMDAEEVILALHKDGKIDIRKHISFLENQQ